MAYATKMHFFFSYFHCLSSALNYWQYREGFNPTGSQLLKPNWLPGCFPSNIDFLWCKGWLMWGICSTIINPLRALALPRTAKEQWVFGVHEPFLVSSPIRKPHFSSQRISVGLSLMDSPCPQVGMGNFTPTCLQAVKPKPAARCTCLCQWLAWPQVASLSFSLSCDF